MNGECAYSVRGAAVDADILRFFNHKKMSIMKSNYYKLRRACDEREQRQALLCDVVTALVFVAMMFVFGYFLFIISPD
jgi:hypothetical protein